MINTYNESNLHKALKIYFSTQNDGQMEVPYKKWIADIMTKDGNLIEIQTANLGALKEKCLEAIKEKKHFTIVHPIITEKKIENYTNTNILVSKRKSPKKENIYSVLEHLTGIYSVLLSKYVTLILIEVKTTEQRIQLDKKTVLKNKPKGRPKTWYKNGKGLTEIGRQHIFHGKKSWLKLLPKLPIEFSSKELKENLLTLEYPKNAYKHANLILWLFSKMQLIEETQKKERRKYYNLSSKKHSSKTKN